MAEAGKLDRRITVQIQQETSPITTEFGEPTTTWVESFQCWAAFEPAGTREFPTAQKMFAETTGRFRMRYREALDPTLNPQVASEYRILFNSSIWNIQQPSLIGRRNDLLIEATNIQPPAES